MSFRPLARTWRWLPPALLSAGLLGCASRPPAPATPTPVETPSAPAEVRPPPLQPATPPAETAPPAPYNAAVEARFPDPVVSYRTPAFDVGRKTYTTNAELQGLMRALAPDRPGASTVSLLELGNSQSGVALQALLFTRLPDRSPAALARSGRPTVLLVAQQHGDEPAGAEALLLLAQELARGRLQDVLDSINVVVLPRANPDGARAGQRMTASGVDANRDHLLLRTPETQAQARLVREFQPMVVVDAHEYSAVGRFNEKFGAVPRYDALLQYAMTANMAPFISKAAEEWFREPMVAALAQQGLTSQWYHSTSTDLADKKISMGGTEPNTGRNADGLKNAISILIETRGVGIGRMHLKRRVFTHVTAIGSVLRSAAERSADLVKLRQYVDADVSAQACQGRVVVSAEPTPSEFTLLMLDPVTGADRSLLVNWDSALALNDVKVRNRPCGYWLAADQGDVATRLRNLGVRVEQAFENGVVQGETYRETSRMLDIEHGVQRIEVQTQSSLIDVQPGSYYVPMSQPLANLVAAALEPDTLHSYAANGLIPDVAKQARVMSLPAMRLNVLP